MKLDKIVFNITDKELFDTIKEDDENSFKDLFERYWKKLYIFSYNVIQDKNVSEDIIQEIFTDLWIRRKEIEIENVSAYLFKAVKFQIFKQFRKRKLIDRHFKEFDNFISEFNTEQDIDYKDLISRVENIISGLPEQRRIIFQLSRHEGLSNKEIAHKLNISVQTVKNQISHALKLIRISI
jgi:RNA polymerase sigma-70 factor (ECF subfamily)